MRHAQSTNNNVWYHKGPFGILDPGLSEEGVRQAHAAGDALNETEVDVVLSSHLLRAMHTAAIVFRRWVLVAPYIGETHITDGLPGGSCFWAPGGCPTYADRVGLSSEEQHGFWAGMPVGRPRAW